MRLETFRAGRAAALSLALLVAACTQHDTAAQTRSSASTQTEIQPVPIAPVDTTAAYALSAAFRSAADRALHAVVYVGVERNVTVASRQQPQLPELIPEEFRRFFQFEFPQQMPPPTRQGAGSGFIISADGEVVTNYHVVENANRILVRLQDGREFEGELVAGDPNTDVALLKIETDGERLPVTQFGDSEQLRVGDWVLALGNPLGFDFTVTAGIVSAKGRQLTRDTLALESYIQTDAAINPGNSGGPLVDLTGRVVGMNTAIGGGGQRFVGYGFAVPSRLVQRVLADLREYGHVRRPRVGVTVAPVTAVDAEAYGLDHVSGAVIRTVEDGLPGARAGLRPGDVVLTLDGHEIRDANDLTARLAQRRPGERVTLGVWRDRRVRDIHVTLGEFEQPDRETDRRATPARDVESRLGFTVERLTADIAGRFDYDRSTGIVVREVSPRIPAGSGLVPGALLLHINGQDVSTPEDVERIAIGLGPGAVVALRFISPGRGETVYNYRVPR